MYGINMLMHRFFFSKFTDHLGDPLQTSIWMNSKTFVSTLWISKSRLQSQLVQLELTLYFWICSCLFHRKVDDYSGQFKIKIEIFQQILHRVTKNTSISLKNILYDKFTESWEVVHNDIVDRGILPEVTRLQNLHSNCQKLEEKVRAISKSHTIKFDANELISFSIGMQKLHPQHYHQSTSCIENGGLNLDHLLLGVRLALPSMLQSIEMQRSRSTNAMVYESNQLKQFSHKFDNLLQKTVQLSAPILEAKNEIDTYNLTPAFESIQSMILSTPTISYDIMRRIDATTQPKRISLLDDIYKLRSETVVPSSSIKPLSREDQSPRGDHKTKPFLSPARLLTKSKLDPMAILLSISKKERKDMHSSSATLKPKSMNFGRQLGPSISRHDFSKTNDITISVPEFSSTLINQLHDKDESMNEQINASLKKSFDKGSSNGRKIRSLLTAGSNIDSSPSGRLEPLITSKLDLSDIKPIKAIDKILEVRYDFFQFT